MRTHFTLALLALGISTMPLLAQQAGTVERLLKVGETQREYLLHIPRGFKKSDKKHAPLVLMLHGRTSDGKAAASSYYGWTKLADKEGFVAAFPTALGKPTSWQPAMPGRENDDTKFLSLLIDTLVEELGLDKERVFMTGHSSGGFMSYSFATVHADKVTAIAPVAGLYLGKDQPALPVSVLSFHGMADDVVAYDKEHGKNATYRGMPSALESAAAFAKYDDCGEKPERTDLANGKVHVDTWADGKAGTRVELYSIEGWGHGWPTAACKVPATELIWKFFQTHARKADKPEESKKKGKEKDIEKESAKDKAAGGDAPQTPGRPSRLVAFFSRQ